MLQFGKSRNSATIQQNSGKMYYILKNDQQKNQQYLTGRSEIQERCKGVHCVDLGESFPTNIYLQNLALIQPRTSLFNFFIFSPALVI